jgi:hypothetical protein
MAITDLIFDQRLHLRRQSAPAKVKQFHFRIKLGNKTQHDVLAATAEDALLYVRRRHPRVRVIETLQIGKGG